VRAFAEKIDVVFTQHGQFVALAFAVTVTQATGTNNRAARNNLARGAAKAATSHARR
jgi:hypothetical protein